MATTTVKQGLSYVQYEADGSTANFILPFPYLEQNDISVEVDGVPDTTFTWLNASEITLSALPSDGALIFISRSTDQDARKVDFQDGGQLSERILDLDSNQIFFIAQEAIDTVSLGLSVNPNTNTVDLGGAKLVNVGEGTDPTDGVNKSQLDALANIAVEAGLARDEAVSANTAAQDAKDAAEAAQEVAEEAAADAQAFAESINPETLASTPRYPLAENLSAGQSIVLAVDEGVTKAFGIRKAGNSTTLTPAIAFNQFSIPMDTDRIALYRFSSTNLVVRIVTIDANGAATSGPEVTITSPTSISRATVCYNPDKNELACVWVTSTFDLRYAVLSISGSTMTEEVQSTFGTASMSLQRIHMKYNTTDNCFMLGYSRTGLTSVFIRTVIPQPLDLAMGPEYDPFAINDLVDWEFVDAPSVGAMLIVLGAAYNGIGTSMQVNFMTQTSGGMNYLNSAYVTTDREFYSEYSKLSFAGWDNSHNRLMIEYNDGFDMETPRAFTCEINSSGSITKNSEVTLPDSALWQFQTPMFVNRGNGKVFGVHFYGGGSTDHTMRTVDYSSGTPVSSPTLQSDIGTIEVDGGYMHPLSNDRLAFTYRNLESTITIPVLIFQGAGAYRYPDLSVDGIMKEAGLAGEVKRVFLKGMIAEDVLSGLTLDGFLYVQDDGTIGHTVTPRLFGVAVSETSLMIYAPDKPSTGLTQDQLIIKGANMSSLSQWQKRPLASNPIQMQRIHFAEGLIDAISFVAIAGGGVVASKLATSVDGETWTYRSVPQANIFNDVWFHQGAGVWYVTASNGTNRLIRSTDGGVTWAVVAATGGPNTAQLTSITGYGGFMYCCSQDTSGSASLWESFDGVSWTAKTVSFGGFSRLITMYRTSDDTVFQLAIRSASGGATGACLQSGMGAEFLDIPMPKTSGFTDGVFDQKTETVYVANTDGWVYYSTDFGATWNRSETQTFGQRLTCGNGYVISTGLNTYGAVWISFDGGKTFKSRIISGKSNAILLYGGAYGKGRFVLPDRNSSLASDVFYLSNVLVDEYE